MLNDEPISLATAIPRRKRGGWDENRANKRSKLDTVDAAINVMEGSNENILQEIHQASLNRGIRENNKNRMAPRSKRKATDIKEVPEGTTQIKSKKRTEQQSPNTVQVTTVQEHMGQDRHSFSHLTHLNLERIDEVTTPNLL